MTTLITSRLEQLDESVHEASPTAHLNAVTWMASTAVEWALSSFIDDQMARNDKYYAEREQKREQLLRVLAYAMDRGLPPQAILGENDKDTEKGLINEAIAKEMAKSFKSQSLSSDVMELLVACGEDEEVLLLQQEAENQRAERIANARKNKASERLAELRYLLTHWFNGVHGATASMDGLPEYMLKVMVAKYDYAMQSQRKYCHRGITIDINAGRQATQVGELKCLNNIIQKNDLGWIYDRIEERQRESQFDDSGTIERGKIGDDERVDITY